MSRTTTIALVLATFAASAGTIVGEPLALAAPRDPVKADALFREGQASLVAGDLPAACSKLADSLALDPTLGTLLHLAFCHEKQGRLYAAWNEFARGAREADRTEQRDRAAFASTRLAEIGRSLPRARLVLPAGERAVAMRVDGLAYEGNLQDEVVVVPAGTHTIEVETAGQKKRSKLLAFSGQEVTVVRFDQTDDPKPRDPTPPSTPEEPPAARDGSETRTLGYVIGGIGLAALGVGTYFGVSTFAKKDEAAKGCDAGGCDPDAKQAGDLAHTYAALSTVFVGAGVAAAGAGLLLVLTAPSARPAAAGVGKPQAGVFIGPAAAGVRGTF